RRGSSGCSCAQFTGFGWFRPSHFSQLDLRYHVLTPGTPVRRVLYQPSMAAAYSAAAAAAVGTGSGAGPGRGLELMDEKAADAALQQRIIQELRSHALWSRRRRPDGTAVEIYVPGGPRPPPAAPTAGPAVSLPPPPAPAPPASIGTVISAERGADGQLLMATLVPCTHDATPGQIVEARLTPGGREMVLLVLYNQRNTVRLAAATALQLPGGGGGGENGGRSVSSKASSPSQSPKRGFFSLGSKGDGGYRRGRR
ncbi:unnamed protein product, partial [Phaeothamnion confervicola]